MIPSLFVKLWPQVQVVTCISDYKSEVPTINPLSLSLINLLEQLTKLRENILRSRLMVYSKRM